MEDLLELLQGLCAIPGPSGRESGVRRHLEERWRPRLESLESDAVGNLLGHLGGSGPALLVHAHMDEVSYVVRHVTEGGFLLLETGQGDNDYSEPRHVVGHEALVLGRDGVCATGIFVGPSGHVVRELKPEDAKRFVLDLGCASREEAEGLGVHIGAPVVFAGSVRHVGGRLVGKALDDRLLLAIVDLLLAELDSGSLAYDLWVAATVQEETGVRGARALASRGAFDRSVALDVAPVGDIPNVGPEEYEGRLGAGPTIVHKDSFVHYDAELTWALVDAANAAGIPFQHGIHRRYGSDGLALIEHGVPTALLAVPTRYTHTPFEMVEPADVRATVELLKAFLTR